MPDIYRTNSLILGASCCATQKFYKCLKVVSIPFFVDSCLETLKKEKVGIYLLYKQKSAQIY